MGHHHKYDESRIHRFEWQDITIENFPADGFILDIGGGGEGIIGRLKGQQVIAIDKSIKELSETPDNHLKIVMDACNLNFLDNTFAVTTAFFSFMFIPPEDHRQVLSEIYRVLKPSGLLHIWDVILPKRPDDKKDRTMFPLNIKLPTETAKTGYGTAWPKDGRTVEHYITNSTAVGFQVVKKNISAGTFYMQLRKP